MAFREDALCCLRPVPSDIDIAQSVMPIKIEEIIRKMGIRDSDFDLYGRYKAKIHPTALYNLPDNGKGKYICVTGITPTPLGEGKTTTTIGLSQALGKYLNKKVMTCIRQPSMGPTFGIKGGAAGGGYSQIIPMEEFNLHLTGDIHAVSLANNLLAAAVDARQFHEDSQTTKALFDRLAKRESNNDQRKFSESMQRRLDRLGIPLINGDIPDETSQNRFCRLDIDDATIAIRRVVDCNDRFLRLITIGQNPTEKHSRQTGFDISVGSEVMAILALSTSMADMRERFQRIIPCFDKQGKPLTADDFGVAGAMAVLMKDALSPTLMQTLEGTPVFVHGGPFANIAHGNSSVIADILAHRLVGNQGFVITEAGFGADIGFEKFCNIKCRVSGIPPDCAVIVATVRALKLHGGGPPVIAGKSLDPIYQTDCLDLVKRGFCNLAAHIRFIIKMGIPVVVCVNARTTDSDDELNFICKESLSVGACRAVMATHWADGGRGALLLAQAVIEAASMPLLSLRRFSHSYSLFAPLKEKIELICRTVYGASTVTFSEKADKFILICEKFGFGHFPICMAKTQYSLSHDPALKGAPTGFVVPIEEVRLFSGAGFITCLCGPIMTMPGLPTRPAFYDIDIHPETNQIVGLF